MKRETRTSCGHWMIEENSAGEKQLEKMLDVLKKWFKVERVTNALKAMKDRTSGRSRLPLLKHKTP